MRFANGVQVAVHIAIAEIVIGSVIWHQDDIDATVPGHGRQPGRVLASEFLGHIVGPESIVVTNTFTLGLLESI